MTQTATSPRYQAAHSQRPRPAATPAMKADMPPFLSPRVASPPRRNVPGTPSPNYFGFQTDGSSYLSDNHAKSNWSPPSSTVRSTAALSPSVVPLDQSPEYEAFRKQSEGNKAFQLGGLSNFKTNMPMSSPSLASRPAQHKTTSQAAVNTAPKDIPASAISHRAVLDASTTELSRSPKRMHSPVSHTESKRRASPPTFDNIQNDMSKGKLGSPKSMDGAGVRLQLPLDNMTASYNNSQKGRAETLPVTSDADTDVFATPQHVVSLLNTNNEDILLLDLRVQTQYANSHISSALSLCIPTTLLKRPSFNVEKLANTFKDEEQRAKFENWRKSSYIIVYDGSSSLLKDATTCLNTIKKFQGEGYDGKLYIIKGGFNDFAKRFPKYVDSGACSASSGSQGVEGDGPEVAPVVGGCPMPATDKPANPFFGNIRQNMDLIGGVGQIELKHPSRETSSAEEEYPEWIKTAAEQNDKGKRVANRFEQIERREKKRMEDALSGKVSFGTPTKPDASDAVRIAGLEKGNKNRYNNIWPFEHSRVRLQGIPSHGCDYFNASHIKAAWSNKRYISTQAPIPATFNDFWNVIWQQDVRVVVMLTAEKEGAQVKAHNYWDQKQYGQIHLDFLSEKRASLEPSRIHKAHQKRPSAVKRNSTKSQNPGVPLATIDTKEDKNEQPYVTVRKFTISHDRFPFEPMREITQLQYSSWPDFGAPAHPAHLLGLVEQTNAVVRATGKVARSSEPEDSERPVLVHCSAGCGRTGTFCTVDSVIDMIKRQRTSQESRHHTPMDIDSTGPEKKRSRTDDERNDAMRKGSSGGFFASQHQHTDEGLEGSWLSRGDVDLVEKTVEDFRHQRISMVQSLRQYVLCYESVMEWIVEDRQLSKDEEKASAK
ncbi:Putative tyrosine-specific protein phosphatase [Septoria linicola]|uniref:protein-tyrosine-phosphatase n=1 Tax=Septoria linicola TaxID=215465 RepID=A0A9Q9ENE9_9PEZI|nr:putative tyrosine-specific protein phosphatase [Septoria linicola]USW55413.1 Putative tyrosine-specific protein phosphatase [Septoria linicola]